MRNLRRPPAWRIARGSDRLMAVSNLVTTTPSPGWYPNPNPARAHSEPTFRWWDGLRWTDLVATESQVAAYPAVKPSAVPPRAPSAPAATPDGELLADWGRRAGAI